MNPEWLADRAPDGRLGKVFPLRLTDRERELLEVAAARDERGRGFYGSKPSIGAYMRKAAIAAARQLIGEKEADRILRPALVSKRASSGNTELQIDPPSKTRADDLGEGARWVSKLASPKEAAYQAELLDFIKGPGGSVVKESKKKRAAAPKRKKGARR